MTCCPRLCASRSPRKRISVSVGPPGGKGTMMRMGFAGHVSAAAANGNSRESARTRTRSMNSGATKFFGNVDVEQPRRVQAQDRCAVVALQPGEHLVGHLPRIGPAA